MHIRTARQGLLGVTGTLRRIAVAWLLSHALAANAADPVRGETLYLTSPFGNRQACAGCHGATPFANNTDTITRARNSRTTIANAISTNPQMSYFGQYYNAVDIQDIAAYLGNTPKTVNFGSVNVGSASTAQSVAIYASTLVSLNLTALSVSGDYVRTGGTCPTSGALAAGSSCTVNIAFAPTTTGTRSGALNISHGDSTTPVTIALTGSGSSATSPALAIQPTSLSFASQPLNTTSAAQLITLSNTGNAPLSLTGFGTSGSGSGDFAITGAGTCSTGTTVAAGANCTLAVTFTPTALGGRTATLTISSNASNGSVSASLSGNGVTAPTPAVSLSATSINFGTVTVGSSAPTSNVVLTNSGTATLNVNSITLTSNPPFSLSHNCAASVAAGSSCTLTLGFTPTAATTSSGSVSIASDAPSSPNTIALSGAGTTQSLPVLAWSGGVTSSSFGDIAVGSSSPARSVTLTNQGPGSVTLQTISVSGAQATDFLIDASGTCAAGASLAAGASCTVAAVFRPSTTGLRSASLGVTSSGINPPSIALSGNGTSSALPALTPAPTSLAFLGPNAPAQTLTLTNSGGATLSVTSIAILNGPFTVAPATNNGCPLGAFDLPPAQSCGVVVSVTAGTATEATGAVRVTSNVSGSPTNIPITHTVPVMTNIGAGGCSIAQPRADGSIDPTLWLLVVIAIGVLRERGRQRRRRLEQPQS